MSVISKLFYELKIYLFRILHTKNVLIGKRLSVRRGFFIKMSNTASIKIGSNCFFNNDCSLNVMERLVIGNDCMFGENVKIYDHDHGHKMGTLFRKQSLMTGAIVIGDNCWLGSNVVVLKGVHIGSNVVIAAGTVVTKDIPSNVIVYQKRSTIVKQN